MVRVVSLAGDQRAFPTEESLEHIICKIEPKLSIEEKAAIESGMERRFWPWFAARDGVVHFDEQDSRWFLGGRSVATYECR